MLDEDPEDMKRVRRAVMKQMIRVDNMIPRGAGPIEKRDLLRDGWITSNYYGDTYFSNLRSEKGLENQRLVDLYLVILQLVLENEAQS